ncbi:hypothetical protein [Pelagibacterium sp.]|uniref:hypothetical protein n=1 Tax=Pelagibacterium sp. TaxID=1967288 RepID=UPI003A935623
MSIPSPRTLKNLLGADALNVSRDPMLMLGIIMCLLPVPLILVFGPLVETSAFQAFAISGMTKMLGAIAVLMPGAMLGWVTGFMLLEDRDDGVLMAVGITPIGRSGFLAYRLIVTIFLTLSVSVGIGLIVLPAQPASVTVLMAMIAAGHAVLCAMFLLAFASNKVEGLALTKLINLALLAPLAALIAPPWRYLAAIVPTFWVGQLVQPAPAMIPPVVATLIALGTTSALVILLRARLRHRTD